MKEKLSSIIQACERQPELGDKIRFDIGEIDQHLDI